MIEGCRIFGSDSWSGPAVFLGGPVYDCDHHLGVVVRSFASMFVC